MLLSVAQEIEEDNRPAFSSQWIIFATSWNYIIVTAYLVYAALISTISYQKNCEAEMDGFPVKYKILWLLSGVSLTNCTVVVISYWLLLSRFDEPLKLNLESYLLIDRHGINLLLLIIEFCLNRFPVQIFHFIYPVGFGVLYGMFNVIYDFAAGSSIYPLTDWRNNTAISIGAFTGTLFFTAIIHVAWYFLYRIKLKVTSSHSENNIV